MAHPSPLNSDASPYTADGLPDVVNCRINLLAAHRKGAFKKPEDEHAGTAELQLSDTAPKLLRYKPDSSPALVLLPTLKQPEPNQYNTLRSKQMQKSLDDPAGNHQAVALSFDVTDEPQYDWAFDRKFRTHIVIVGKVFYPILWNETAKSNMSRNKFAQLFPPSDTLAHVFLSSLESTLAIDGSKWLIQSNLIDLCRLKHDHEPTGKGYRVLRIKGPYFLQTDSLVPQISRMIKKIGIALQMDIGTRPDVMFVQSVIINFFDSRSLLADGGHGLQTLQDIEKEANLDTIDYHFSRVVKSLHGSLLVVHMTRGVLHLSIPGFDRIMLDANDPDRRTACIPTCYFIEMYSPPGAGDSLTFVIGSSIPMWRSP